MNFQTLFQCIRSQTSEIENKRRLRGSDCASGDDSFGSAVSAAGRASDRDREFAFHSNSLLFTPFPV